MAHKPNILMKNLFEKLLVNDRVAHESDVKLLTNARLTSDKALFRALHDRSLKLEVRQAACRVLGRGGGSQATRTLLDLLRRGDAGLTFEAAKSLIALEANHDIPQISQIMMRGRTYRNRAAAAYVLGILGGGTASRSLVEVLNGTDTPEVRSHAAEALGHIADKNATESLMRGLRDRNAKVRLWSAFALGEIGDPRALPALQQLALKDESIVPKIGTVSREGRRAIRRLKAKSKSS